MIKMAALRVKEPPRHRLLVNALNNPPDPRQLKNTRSHVFQRDPWVTPNGSKAIPAGLGPKTVDHARIFSTLDMGPGEFFPCRSNICGLHLGVVVDEVRNIARQTLPTRSHEASQVIDKIRENAIGLDRIPAEIGGTEINSEASGGDRNHKRESRGEALEVEPDPVFRIYISSIRPRRVIFRNKVIVHGIRVGLGVNADLPLVEVERGHP